MLRACIATVGWLAATVIFPVDAFGAAPTVPAETGPRETVLEVEVNSVPAPDALVVLRDEHDDLWLAVTDFEALRLRPPQAPALVFAGRHYLPVRAIDGSRVRIDAVLQRAIITVPAPALLTTRMDLDAQAPRREVHTGRGAFLNYEVIGSNIEHRRSAAGSSELGLFTQQGVLTHSLAAGDASGSTRVVRLETTWRHDRPAALQSLRLGDGVSVGGAWGSATRFGGLQWGTDFSLRPDLITTPLLTVGGSAALPSSVDVLMNGQNVGSQAVPAGPFVIDRLPAVTGAGDVQLVVRDALGREQVIAVPFYSSSALLQPGLSDYSFEVGAERRNFTLRDNDYGRLFAAATWRRGLTAGLTLEAHGEFLRSGPRALGVDVSARIANLGVARLTTAVGGEPGRAGARFGIGLERSARGLSFALRSEWSGSSYRQISDAGDGVFAGPRPERRTIAQLGASLGAAGTLSVAVAQDALRHAPDRRVLAISHSVSLGGVGYLSLTASRLRGENRGTSAFLALTVPLGKGSSASFAARRERTGDLHQNRAEATLQQTAPVGRGFGYSVNAATGGDLRAGWTAHFDATAVEFEAVRTDGATAQRATLTGGLVWLGGALRATRQVDDSFALVNVGGIPDVQVFLENQPVARTDEHGLALIRNLRPYETNRISVDPAKLPIDTWIDTSTAMVSPAFRSGTEIAFALRRERGVVVRLRRADGSSVPSGAVVRLGAQSYPVARQGMTYLVADEARIRATAVWSGGSCVFELQRPEGDDPLPDLGIITCGSAGDTR
ncbi:MAG: fimbria/pilus outer membrane usher protein [Steroidobacteraceae bacterium]